jgi:YfiR/HmsC-like
MKSALLALLSLVMVQTIVLGSTIKLDEYKAKSMIIYRVCKFTKWPQKDGINPTRPFIISILGKLPADSGIEIPGKDYLGKRKILIRNVTILEDIDTSDVLFIAPSVSNRINSIIKYIGNKSILTVGDTEGLGESGVSINIFRKGNKLNFEINPGAIKKANLHIHSQLFSMGKLVETKSIAQQNNNTGDF